MGVLKLFGLFFAINLFTIGGGYVMLPILHGYFVDQYGLLTNREFLEAVALGQVTPGPLTVMNAFIGYKVSGIPGAAAATLGTVEIDDNLGRGAVVTLKVSPRPKVAESPSGTLESSPRLSNRQKQVLSIVMELGSAGPSAVARELSVGLSTAYRDLASLEEAGLIVADESGKRALTERGVTLLDSILK